MKRIFATNVCCSPVMRWSSATNFSLTFSNPAHFNFQPQTIHCQSGASMKKTHHNSKHSQYGASIRRQGLAIALAAAVFATGCNPKEVTKESSPRTVKMLTVANTTQTLTRPFAGVVQACNRSSLSFQVGGRIEKLSVEIGDSVQKGQVLGELDPAPFELRVRQAEADVQAACAQMAEREKRFASEQRLLPKGATTQTEYDQTEAAFTAAKSQLEVAESATHLAKRDLSHAKLTAPISGRIAKKHLQNYTQVAPGVCLLELDGEGDFEVATAIPEGFIAHTGDKVEVTLKSSGTASVEGAITQIGSRSDIGNSMPVLVRLAQVPNGLRTGTAAEVRFKDSNRTENAFIPVSGLIPGSNANTGFVFVFDPQKEVVLKRSVQLGNPQEDGFSAISGLAAGEIIAAAGVTFLTDGQQVRVWNSAEIKVQAGNRASTQEDSHTGKSK